MLAVLTVMTAASRAFPLPETQPSATPRPWTRPLVARIGTLASVAHHRPDHQPPGLCKNGTIICS